MFVTGAASLARPPFAPPSEGLSPLPPNLALCDSFHPRVLHFCLVRLGPPCAGGGAPHQRCRAKAHGAVQRLSQSWSVKVGFLLTVSKCLWQRLTEMYGERGG